MVRTIWRISRLLLLISTACFQAGFCGAAPPAYDLGDLEALVVEKSPLVGAYHERLMSARKHLEQLRCEYGPEFVFRAGYEPVDRTTNGIRDQEYRVAGRVEQDLVKLFGIRPRKIDESKGELQVAQSEFAETRAKSIFDLRQVYLDGLEERLQVEGNGRLEKIYEELFEIRQKRRKSGEELPSEVLKAQKELISARELSRRHADFYSTVKDSLGQSLGIAPDLIEFRSPRLPPLPEEEHFVSVVRENRGIVRKYEGKARQEISRAAMAGLHNVRLSPYVGYFVEQTEDLGTQTGPEAGVIFSIPFLTGKIREKEAQRYRHMEESWRMEERQVVEDIQKQIRYAYRNMEIEESRIAAAAKTIEFQESEIRVERARIQSPVAAAPGDTARVLEMEADVVRTDMEKGLSELKKARIYFELLYLAGLDNFPTGQGKMSPSAKTVTPRGVWVWKTERFLEEGPSRQALLAMRRAGQVERVYLSLDRSMLDGFPGHAGVANLVSLLHLSGMRVSALVGDGGWIYPAKRERLTGALEKIASHNRAVEPGQRFDAVHLDIEPQALPEWKEGGAAKKQELLSLLLDTVKEARSRLSAPEASIPLEVDIPVSYGKISPTDLDGIVGAADTVVVMAYGIRDADRLTEVLGEEMDVASRQKKHFVVGLRAKDFSGQEELERLVSEMQGRLQGLPSFGGFAVHDFDRYQALLAR